MAKLKSSRSKLKSSRSKVKKGGSPPAGSTSSDVDLGKFSEEVVSEITGEKKKEKKKQTFFIGDYILGWKWWPQAITALLMGVVGFLLWLYDHYVNSRSH